MKLQCLVLAAAISLAAGEKTGIFDKIRTETFCRTPYGTRNITSVPTTRNTIHVVYTVNSTKRIEPIVTVTPDHITQTTYEIYISTVESTTNPKPDQTNATVVATEYKTILVTHTMTTITERSTETTQTTFVLPTTVPAPKFFAPIMDTLDGATRRRDEGLPNNQSVGIHEPGYAEDEEPEPPGHSVASYFKSLLGGANFRRSEMHKKRSGLYNKRSGVYNNRGGIENYPQRVICDYTIFVPKTVTYTRFADVRTMTLEPPVLLQTDNNVVESIKTVFLPTVEVITISTTTYEIHSSIIASTTYTSTETNTNTVKAAWPTINEMCDKGNYAVGGTISPYECCEACVAYPKCAGNGWVNGLCTLITVPDSSKCHIKPCSGELRYSRDTGGSWIFSNGRFMKWDKVG
ncbi:hypothetical protein EDB81DRAFT_882661 [Dactylonectria macrodidyma]|uniref:Uncharacterized protein n=1 Tax=Dactylonectria macrodidyma TaxID=307937 RepID=A0A9P9J9J7_9HYPO|nr:hypothetical protein EDB81DRAFT_882661 [Dactylonectria macrodidyma]